MSEFRGSTFDKKFTREYIVQRSDAPVRGFLNSDNPLSQLIMLPNGKDYQADYLFERSEWKDYEKETKRIFSNPEGLKEVLGSYYSGRDKILEAMENILAHKDDSLEVLFDFYENYVEVMTSSFADIYIQPWVYDAEFIPYIKREIEKSLGEGSAEEILQAVSLPLKLTDVQKAQLTTQESFLEGSLEEDLPSIVEDYCWLNVYNINHKPVGEEYFREFLKGKDRSEVQKEVFETKETIRKNQKILEENLNEIADPDLKKILQLMNEYSYVRTERIGVLKQTYYGLTVLFKKLHDKMNTVRGYECNFLDVISLTTPEILEFIGNETLPDQEELNMRSSTAYAYYYNKDTFELIKDERELAALREGINITHGEKKVEGKVAFTGKATGRVRLVTSMDEVEKLKEGEILVSTMTFPEYVHAMKKAAAFVTNEGGITCHAAIVAREMKKPCIIGTQNATQVFKNGDSVEVDATNGIVRIV